MPLVEQKLLTLQEQQCTWVHNVFLEGFLLLNNNINFYFLILYILCFWILYTILSLFSFFFLFCLLCGFLLTITLSVLLLFTHSGYSFWYLFSVSDLQTQVLVSGKKKYLDIFFTRNKCLCLQTFLPKSRQSSIPY